MKLSINHVTKDYGKGKLGLSDFSLELETGVVGLLGPNGAGKSTLMKMIATITKPSSGNILLDGVDIVKEPDAMRNILGYLPQDFGVYPNLNAYEFLKYMAAMKGVGGDQMKSRITALLEGVNLIEVAKKPIGSYSGGMKQRIGIAQALLNDPKILIVDEPTVGLDPEERVRFRHLITQLAGNAIVVLSSHIVSDIETIADTVAVMQNSKLLAFGSLDEIVSNADGKVFETIIPVDHLTSFKSTYKVVNTVRKKEQLLVRFISEEIIVNATAVDAGLEDAYLWMVK